MTESQATTIQRLNTALHGRYRIERELGAGGMATVFLAEDLRHDRKVALKVLKPELAAVVGAERFLAEIKTTAQLQHPNILPLFDSGEADSFLFYVMPYVEGESLRDRISREKQLPVDEAVRIATDIAEALDHAHRQGVIHRDIKPANVLLRDGRPLVADFGIALAVSAAGGGRLTETGLSVGTPWYMSPEQAAADRDPDARSDVYSLGCVLYEMLVGDPPHTASTAQAVVAKILTETPQPPALHRSTVPPHVNAAVVTALQRLPADRFAGAAEFAAVLQGKAPPPAAHRTAGPDESVTGRGTIVLAATTLVLALLAGWAWLRPKAPSPATTGAGWTLPVTLPDSIRLTGAPSVSADGSVLVFGAEGPDGESVWVRRSNSERFAQIRGTEDGIGPSISPSGEQVVFIRFWANAAYVVLVGGGEPLLVAGGFFEGGWIDEDDLIFSGDDGLVRSPVTGGDPVRISTVDAEGGEASHRHPAVLPDEAGFLFTVVPSTADPDLSGSMIAAVGPDGGVHHTVAAGTNPQYAEPGHILAVRDGGIWAYPFDLQSLQTTGPGRLVIPGVDTGRFGSPLSVSRDGRIFYMKGRSLTRRDLTRVDREGTEEAIDTAWTGDFRSLDVSPDGRRVAVWNVLGLATEVIDIRDLTTGALVRLERPGTFLRQPSFSADAASLVLAGFGYETSSEAGIYRTSVTGEAPLEEIFKEEPGNRPATPALAPDQQRLYYRTFETLGTGGDLWVRSIGEAGSGSVPLTDTPEAKEIHPSLSPDGRWLAYASNESGRNELYVRATDPARVERWQVTRSGASGQPRWSDDGRRLFFVSGDSLYEADVATEPTFRLLDRRALFAADNYDPFFDPHPDGGFIMIRKRRPGGEGYRIIMHEHWDADGGR